MPGLEVDRKEQSDFVSSALLRRLLGFRVVHALSYFSTLGYDAVIGSTLFYALVLQKIWRTRTRYLYLNFSLTRFIYTRRSHLAKWFVAWVLDRADAIISPSQVQSNFLKHALPGYSGKLAVVPLGVDEKYYLPHYEGREDFILAVGRDNGRDYATAIEAARRLPQERFVIVCSRRNLTGITDIPPNVSVVYDAPLSEVRGLYYRARLMLLITHNDSFGDGSDCSGQTVLLDAMASGLPVIASRKKYIHEYVKDGEEALLVNFYDPEDIMAKLFMLKDPLLALRLARAARTRVETEFSTHKMAERLYRILTDVLSEPQ